MNRASPLHESTSWAVRVTAAAHPAEGTNSPRSLLPGGDSDLTHMNASLNAHLSVIRSNAALSDELEKRRTAEDELMHHVQRLRCEQQQHADALVDALMRSSNYIPEEPPTLRRTASTASAASAASATSAASDNHSGGDSSVPSQDGSNALAPDAADEIFAAGKRRNDVGDFWGAYALFMHAYMLRPRSAVLLSLANMSLKLNEPWLAAAVYRRVCESKGVASPRQVEVARAKLVEAERALVADAAPTSQAHPTQLRAPRSVLLAEAERTSSATLLQAEKRVEEAERRAALAEARAFRMREELRRQLCEGVAHVTSAVHSAALQLSRLDAVLAETPQAATGSQQLVPEEQEAPQPPTPRPPSPQTPSPRPPSPQPPSPQPPSPQRPTPQPPSPQPQTFEPPTASVAGSPSLPLPPLPTQAAPLPPDAPFNSHLVPGGDLLPLPTAAALLPSTATNIDSTLSADGERRGASSSSAASSPAGMHEGAISRDCACTPSTAAQELMAPAADATPALRTPPQRVPSIGRSPLRSAPSPSPLNPNALPFTIPMLFMHCPEPSSSSTVGSSAGTVARDPRAFEQVD